MSRRETLKAAVELAIERGWDFSRISNRLQPNWPWEVDGPDPSFAVFHHVENPQLGKSAFWAVDQASVIYNHDFAKALWGDDWTHHLQQMVVADDPITYLGENLDF